MRGLMNRCFGILLVACCCFSVHAGSVKVKAKGSAPYGLRASTKVRNLAIEDAKINAVRKYAADFDSARFKVFEQSFAEVERNIDLYVMDYVLIDSEKNKTTKTFDVYIEATINQNEIEKLTRTTAASIAGAGKGGEAPYITMIMVGREPKTQKRFKTKETDISQASRLENSEDTVSMDEGGTVADAYGEVTTSTTTGGAVERKADEIVYRCFSVGDADAAMNEVFSKAGYEVVDPLDAELDVYIFRTEFSVGADITTSSRKDAIRQCRELDISFFTVGYMDVGMPEKDSATGMDRVYVKVSAKMTDLRKRLPKTVASIRGIQYAGLGSTPEVARQNALNAAARNSAKDIVDQLRAKGVMAN